MGSEIRQTIIRHAVCQLNLIVSLINWLILLSIIIGLGKYTEYSVTVAARTAAGVGPFYAPGVRVRTEESSKLN